MTRRSYSQYCGLAQALDLVGERWMLLIVRDLAIRPRRFGEILDGLPGLGTSLLSERLKNLRGRQDHRAGYHRQRPGRCRVSPHCPRRSPSPRPAAVSSLGRNVSGPNQRRRVFTGLAVLCGPVSLPS